MARTPTTKTAPAEAPQLLPAVVERMETAQNMALSTAETDEVFAAGVDLGRIEALDFLAVTANTAMLAIYEKVKKSKAWRLMRNPQDGRNGHFESLEQFCEVKLGKSYKRLRTLAAQRNLIGQEAFEQAERIGLRDVDYNAIKALPAPDQELVRRAVEESRSRDEVLDLLQELAARHGQEKQALAAEIAELKADKEATERVLADKGRAIDRLKAQAERMKTAPPDELLAADLKELAERANTALAYVRGNLRLGFAKLSAREEIGPDEPSHRHVMAGYLNELEREIAILREDFHLHAVTGA